ESLVEACRELALVPARLDEVLGQELEGVEHGDDVGELIRVGGGQDASAVAHFHSLVAGEWQSRQGGAVRRRQVHSPDARPSCGVPLTHLSYEEAPSWRR